MISRGGPVSPNRQATDWLARLHADDRTSEDEAMFRAWLAADPGNADAFDRASSVWDAVGGLSAQPIARERPASLLSRRAALVGGGAAVLVGGSVLGWREAVAGGYRTEIGEQRRLRLDDGTRVMLDTATQIRFRADGDERRLMLKAGRVALEIAADPRPFVIEAGNARAVAGAARLDVRTDERGFALTAIDGTARVEGEGPARAVATGERVAAVAGGPARIDRPEIEDLTAWQSGRLAFRDQTLAEAAREMNRYTTRPLVIADPAAAALRLSGVYRVGDPEAFARSLSLLLPVRIDAGPERIRIASAA